MTQETMTLTRALAEVKHTRSKFERQLQSARFCAVSQGLDTSKRLISEAGAVGIEAFEKAAASSMQGCTDLIKRYYAIRKALIHANVITKVKIGSVEMTIAEAIERKTSIAMEKQLLIAMRNQFAAAQSANDQLNTRLLDTIERSLLQIYGTERSQVTEAQSRIIGESKRREFEPAIVDPLGLLKLIEVLTTDIEDFENEVNYSLSEVNASTSISVEY